MTPVTIPHSHAFPLASDHVGRDLQIWIAEPVAGFRPLPEGPRKVRYVLDADLFFGTAVETSRLMLQLYGELPPLLVVGIAYGAEPAVQGQLRGRDFTPSADPGYDRMTASIPGFEPLLPEGERLGGADRFLAFVREELQPFVAERYDLEPGGGSVFGSSLAGLFATYALLRAPDTFSRYVVTSPALWWNDGQVLALAETAETLDQADLEARVHLAAGSREEDPAIPMLAHYKLVTNTRELARRLEARNNSGLQVKLDILEGETHTTAVPVSLARGLRAVFSR